MKTTRKKHEEEMNKIVAAVSCRRWMRAVFCGRSFLCGMLRRSVFGRHDWLRQRNGQYERYIITSAISSQSSTTYMKECQNASRKRQKSPDPRLHLTIIIVVGVVYMRSRRRGALRIMLSTRSSSCWPSLSASTKMQNTDIKELTSAASAADDTTARFSL